MRSLPQLAGVLVVCLLAVAVVAQQGVIQNPASAHPLTPSQVKDLNDYIHSAWTTLRRSQTDCASLVDTKLTTKPVLYVPADIPVPPAVQALESKCGNRVVKLPRPIQKMGDVKVSEVQPPGLLYLPNPYVVPGGRFNEMYGWDSYFIIRGLVQDGMLELADDMIDNFFFEIEHYGAILNANRTYYFTRSQPPFLTSMIVAVHDAQKARGKEERGWLERAYAFAVRDHNMWVAEQQMAGDTGLSRYFDFGEGPAPESLKDETDHYQKVAEYFL